MPPLDDRTMVAAGILAIGGALLIIAYIVDELIYEAWRTRVMLEAHSHALDRIGRDTTHEESEHAAKTLDMGESREPRAG